MTNPSQILREARHVVVQDYPRQEIPEALTRAGLEVTIYGGPNEADILALDLVDDAVVSRAVGHRPDTADLLYVYRPLSEIDAILTDARRMGVRTIWRHIDPEEDASTAQLPGASRSRRPA